MQTLIVYDDNGVIFNQTNGNYIVPVGLQHIEVEIPEGKIVIGVDVVNHVAIFADIPLTDTEMLQQALSEATMLISQQQEEIDNTNLALSELTTLISLIGGNE